MCTKSIGNGRGSGSRGRGRGHGDGPGGCGGDQNNTQGKWGATKGVPATPGMNLSLGDGV